MRVARVGFFLGCLAGGGSCGGVSLETISGTILFAARAGRGGKHGEWRWLGAGKRGGVAQAFLGKSFRGNIYLRYRS